MEHNELEALYKDAVSYGVRYKTLRCATEPTTVTLRTQIADLLGYRERSLVRVLPVVIEAICNKLYIQSITAQDTILNDWLTANDWDRLQREIYDTVSRDGYAYALINWIDTNPVFTVLHAFDGTSGVWAKVDKLSKAITFAANIWKYNDTWYMDVYYSDRVEKYHKQKDLWKARIDTDDISEDGIEVWPISLLDNQGLPLGVPIIAFGCGDSDVEDAVQTQHDINEAIIDMLAVSRNQGWPQRYIKTDDATPDVVKNPFGGVATDQFGLPLKNAKFKAEPGSILKINGEIGQLDSIPVDTNTIDKLLEVISLITSVPHYYFRGNFPSGIALIQAETRLNAKVEDRQEELSTAIILLLRYALKLSNVYESTAYNTEQDIVIVWYPPQVETEDLRIDKQKNTYSLATTAYTLGIMSLEQAVRSIHPDWEEKDIQLEVAKIQTEKQLLSLG